MARTKFFVDLNSLVTATNDLDAQNAAWRLCRSAYEFARLQRVQPDQTWTNEEETQFKEQFEPGIIAFAAELDGICSVPRAENLYTAKLYISTFQFIRTDLLQLYETLRGSNSTTELQKAMNTLEEEQIYLNRCIDEWRYDFRRYQPNEWEMPCLEGIPKEHKWWNKELGITNNNVSEDDSDSDSTE
jgi:hypothetical protein